jgi:hypothetical protein
VLIVNQYLVIIYFWFSGKTVKQIHKEKRSIFWDITDCSPMKINRALYASARNNPTFSRAAYITSCLIYTGLLIRLLFNPEDEDDVFLRNVS